MTNTQTSQVILKRRYPAMGSDGQSYEIHVYVKTTAAAPPDQLAPIERISSVRTADGTVLRVIGKGHYEIADRGITLTSTAADAI